MINLQAELAVQSFCFRGFQSHEEVIAKVKECGLSAIELCRKHVDFSDDSKFEEIVSLYHDAGVKIVGIGVNPFAGNEAEETKLFEFVKLAGAKFMSVDFNVDATPECYRIAEKLADKYDILLGIHNHGGRHWLGTVQMLHHVFNITSERIGLCLDTAWAIDSRENPIEMARKFHNRLYGVHFKDFVYNRMRQHEDVVIGTGILDLPALLAALKEIDFNGYGVLEYEGDVNNPVPALKECVDTIRQEAKRL